MVAAAPKVLAVIQARGGSKGIEGKNIRDFAGHPLIAYSIAAAQAAKGVDRVIVSTDDERIARVARAYGAEVPFLRPPQFAGDDAVDFDLFAHALEWLATNEDYIPDLVVQLRPTSPLRPVGLIDAGITLIQTDSNATCVRGVTCPRENPFKMWRPDGNYLRPLLGDEFDEPYNMPRQKLPETVWQTGHIDVIRRETIIRDRTLTGDRVLPLTVDANYCIDIDTLQDWEQGEWLLRNGGVRVDMPAGGYWPESPALVVFDFDGVMTDNKVYLSQSGEESVRCDRGDGMGIEMLRDAGVVAVVLSKEQNPVVTARATKLGMECWQGVDDKWPLLEQKLRQRGIRREDVVYVGNDVNDLQCMEQVGCGVAVADAVPEVLAAADVVLSKQGGQGAVREVCDRIRAIAITLREGNNASNG